MAFSAERMCARCTLSGLTDLRARPSDRARLAFSARRSRREAEELARGLIVSALVAGVVGLLTGIAIACAIGVMP